MRNKNGTKYSVTGALSYSPCTVMCYDDMVDDPDGRITGVADPNQYGSP